MARFQPIEIDERRFDWGVVHFVDKRTIRIEANAFCVVFHRWYAPRGTYRQWTRFKSRLIYDKNLDIYKIYKIANKYEITHEVARRK